MFSNPSKTNFNFSAQFNLLSASAFNLDQSKNMSFGKEVMAFSIVFHLFVMICAPILAFLEFFIPPQNKCFREYTRISLSFCWCACVSVRLCVCVSVWVQNTTFCQSLPRGIKSSSHIQ